MADFIGFGNGVLTVVKAAVSNMSAADCAKFLVAQQTSVQQARVKERTEGGVKNNTATGAKTAPNQPAPGSAMARLNAMMKGK